VCLTGRRRRRYLRGVRCILAAPFETHFPRTRPRNRIAVLIGQRHDYVVERSLDVRLPVRLDDDIFFADRAAASLLSFRHIRIVLPIR